MTVTLQITERHIKDATGRNCDGCPVALALTEFFEPYGRASVSGPRSRTPPFGARP
jgi:hypothetical protein